jgi:hypothetical protein
MPLLSKTDFDAMARAIEVARAESPARARQIDGMLVDQPNGSASLRLRRAERRAAFEALGICARLDQRHRHGAARAGRCAPCPVRSAAVAADARQRPQPVRAPPARCAQPSYALNRAIKYRARGWEPSRGKWGIHVGR